MGHRRWSNGAVRGSGVMRTVVLAMPLAAAALAAPIIAGAIIGTVLREKLEAPVALEPAMPGSIVRTMLVGQLRIMVAVEFAVARAVVATTALAARPVATAVIVVGIVSGPVVVTATLAAGVVAPTMVITGVMPAAIIATILCQNDLARLGCCKRHGAVGDRLAVTVAGPASNRAAPASSASLRLVCMSISERWRFDVHTRSIAGAVPRPLKPKRRLCFRMLTIDDLRERRS